MFWNGLEKDKNIMNIYGNKTIFSMYFIHHLLAYLGSVFNPKGIIFRSYNLTGQENSIHGLLFSSYLTAKIHFYKLIEQRVFIRYFICIIVCIIIINYHSSLSSFLLLWFRTRKVDDL